MPMSKQGIAKYLGKAQRYDAGQEAGQAKPGIDENNLCSIALSANACLLHTPGIGSIL